MQIILLVKANHETVGGSSLPSPYRPFLRALAWMTLDAVQFVPFNCMYDGGFDHMDNLVRWWLGLGIRCGVAAGGPGGALCPFRHSSHPTTSKHFFRCYLSWSRLWYRSASSFWPYSGLWLTAHA